MKKTLIFTLLILVSLGISAQRSRRAKTPPPPTPEELAELARQEKYDRKLQAVERVTFIDSVLVKKSEVIDVLSLGNENGSVHSYSEYFKDVKVDSLNLTLFRSQLGDKIIFSQRDANNILQLYASEKLGTKWSQHQLLTGLQDTISKNYPYMLSDGMTMYYAAQDKDGLGGYDIYKTRWDIDEQRFLKPENIGMPFNSEANDYLYLIDEFNELGWFVTDRGHKGDTVCIYTFIPNDSRKIYDSMAYGRDTLVALANINSIRDTWTNKEAVTKALKRLENINQNNKKNNTIDFVFVVNDNIRYTKLNQFRHTQSQPLAKKWLAIIGEIEKMYNELDSLRLQYRLAKSNEKSQLGNRILKLEKKYEQALAEKHQLEKDIRTYEQR